jgi:hypothetical protein
MSTFTRRIPFLALALCGLFAAGQASAEIKIGVVNFEKLLEDAPQTKAAMQALDNEFGPRRCAISSASFSARRGNSRTTRRPARTRKSARFSDTWYRRSRRTRTRRASIWYWARGCSSPNRHSISPPKCWPCSPANRGYLRGARRPRRLPHRRSRNSPLILSHGMCASAEGL